MEWGCTSGRVLRHFSDEADATEFWGIDVDQTSIDWAKASLSPPFHFLCCSEYPHLPFSDDKFSLVYAISVMTHIGHFRDMWLMELRRILRAGGILVLTINDEHTIETYKHDRPGWAPEELDFSQAEDHEFTVVYGRNWADTFTLFTTDYVRREWGRYFEILDIKVRAENNRQSAVVLRKHR